VINDAHCHFFSSPFFAPLGGDAAIERLGWDPPGAAEALADRWVAELDRHHVSRATLIASVADDAASVAAAIARHPRRLVGFFMVDPIRPDAAGAARDVIGRGALRGMPLPRHAPLSDSG
jgi:predicted TIM-barrel fold metal-dependent hydrolase